MLNIISVQLPKVQLCKSVCTVETSIADSRRSKHVRPGHQLLLEDCTKAGKRFHVARAKCKSIVVMDIQLAKEMMMMIKKGKELVAERVLCHESIFLQ